jgi:ACS family hexuronate transporter-like MFS transporter
MAAFTQVLMSHTPIVAEVPAKSAGAAAIPRGTLIVLGALLLGETTINYIDRQVLSVLAPTLRDEFGWSNVEYATVLNAFLLTYAVAYSAAGWALDKLGIRRGLTLAVIWWSTAGALTGLSRGLWSMSAFRSLLAVGEAGAWPAFAKAAATWVPAEARSLFIGACNSGSSLGAMIAAPLVAAITLATNWRMAFVVTGLIGFVWVAIFQMFARRHPEFAEADKGDRESRRKGWLSLLGYRQTWAVFFCRFFADPVWYFFIFWIPEFLARERGMNLAGIGLVAWIPFLFADISNFVSGYIALRLQKAGWNVNRTRKALMIFSACFSPIGIFAAFAQSVFWTIALISAAIFFWIFWSVTVHTLPGDYFPPAQVGSVYGFAGTGSTIGTALATWGVGYVLDSRFGYTPVFIGVSLLMPIAMIVGLSLMGRVEPVSDSEF